MKQTKRIQFFIFGALISIASCYFIFAGDGTRRWSPNDMVLYRLQETFKTDAHSKCLLQCHSIDEETLKNIWFDGDVIFSESQTKGEEKTYVVIAENLKAQEVRLTFDCYLEESKLVSAKPIEHNVTCNCN